MASEVRCILSGQEKIIIIDNSGSQNWAIKPGNTEIVHHDGSPVARYEEAREFLRMAIPFLSIDAPNGIELYFINPVHGRRSHPGIHSYEQVLDLLAVPPYGGTPLLEAWNDVQLRYRHAVTEQGVVTVIITDGAPNDTIAFRNAIKNRLNPSKNVVNFLVTTDQDTDVEYLDDMDTLIPAVDVTDDYQTELAQIRKKRGHSYQFSRGDYVLKAVIGGASPKIDSQDEDSQEGRSRCRCTIL